MLKNWLFSFLLFFVSGCVSIPKETGVLNTMLVSQIAEAKKSNLALIDEWARQRKEKVEAILHYHWVPNFIIKFLDNPVVKEDMDKIVCENKGKFDRALIIRDIVEAISTKIESKRKEWLSVIEDERDLLKIALTNHYAEIERMHQAITANIQSVIKGQEFEKDIREALSKPIREIAPIDKTNRKLEELLEKETNP